MKTAELPLQSCPTCGQLMLPRLNQAGSYCPVCDPQPSSQGGAHRSVSDLPPGVLQTNPEFDPMTLLGKVVGGRYRLEEVIGQGAMGAVYRGVQLALAKPYAIKVLLPSLTSDPQFVGRFQQEARIAAAIRHPGLVEVFDYGVEDGIAFYVMELLLGQTLADLVGDDRVVSPEETVRFVAEAADAVAAAHDRGVIHRDLKPGNIFLARGATCRPLVKVLDFGVSKAAVFSAAAGAPTTMSGWVCGTPAFMSPEQTAAGSPTAAAISTRSASSSIGS